MRATPLAFCFLFVNDPATTAIYTLSLHDALPICLTRSSFWLAGPAAAGAVVATAGPGWAFAGRSEEHTSELQSHHDLVCRLLLEKKKKRPQTQQRSQFTATPKLPLQ